MFSTKFFIIEFPPRPIYIAIMWFHRNYFFLGTGAIVLILTALYGFGGSDWMNGLARQNAQSNWNDFLNYTNIFRNFLNSFGHLSWLHLLGNVVAFSVMGVYLERKFGTIKLIILILAMAFFTSIATGANHQSSHWMGFSGVNFGLKFFILIDCIFTLCNRDTRNKTNIIFTMIAIVWIAIIFSVEIDPTFRFRVYDWTNTGHYSGALAGLVFGLAFNVLKLEKPQAR